MYAQMKTVRQPVLPGGGILPLTLQRETFREYQPRAAEVDREAARGLLEEQLQKQLGDLIGENGEVEDVQFSARIAGEQLEVTLTAQCLEEIGQEMPGEEEIPESP